MKFTKLPVNVFKKIQLNAGIILSSFDPSTETVTQSNIIGATSGGVNFTATPNYSDFGEDIDNCPKNTKELKKLDDWTVTMSGTFVAVSTELAKTLVGSGSVTPGTATYALTSDTDIVAGKTYYTRSGTSPDYVYTAVVSPVKSSLSSYYEVTSTSADKITPRGDVAQSDFETIWWVGDYSDENGESGGGFVAIKLINGLSTGGFQIQSSDKSKGTFSFEFTGHYSMADTSVVPFEIYIKEGLA